jgi:micrococcal nuclease
MRQPFIAIYLAIALAASLAPPALAHSGGFNNDGCHTQRSTGDFHCHHSEAVATYYLQKFAGEGLSYRADVLEVIDGDTVRVRAKIWLNHVVETLVRVRGIDTPERGKRAKCKQERKQASLARQKLKKLAGEQVFLYKVTFDKYGGRVVADVYSPQFENLGLILINEGHARPYNGRGKRKPWCHAP